MCIPFWKCAFISKKVVDCDGMFVGVEVLAKSDKSRKCGNKGGCDHFFEIGGMSLWLCGGSVVGVFGEPRLRIFDLE